MFLQAVSDQRHTFENEVAYEKTVWSASVPQFPHVSVSVDPFLVLPEPAKTCVRTPGCYSDTLKSPDSRVVAPGLDEVATRPQVAVRGLWKGFVTSDLGLAMGFL